MSRLSLTDLYRIAVPGDPQLRPDGAAVAYTVTTADKDSDENRSEIWLAAPGAEPRRLTSGPHDLAPRWSPDGRTLAFLRPVDGRPQLHLLPMDGGEPRALTGAAAGPAVWSLDGSRLAFTAPHGEPEANAPVVADTLEYKADGPGLLRGVRSHVFVVEVATGERVQLTDGDFHAGPPSWSPDGQQLAFVTSMEEDRDLTPAGAVYVVGLEGAAPKRLTEQDVICAGVWWLGERLVVAGFKGDPTGHTRLFTLEAGGLAEVETGLDRNVMLGHSGYPGAPPVLLGEELLFCARDGGLTHLYGAPGRTKVGGEHSVSGVSVAGARLAYVAATPSSPGDIYLDGERLTDHTLPDLELFPLERRLFTAPDGTPVEGFLLRDPERTGAGPLLLDVHGGPHNAWGPVFDGVHLYHQVLAARGWSVLTLNPRGSDGYGEAFYTAAVGAWGLSDAEDFLSPIDALVAEGVADPDRLAVTGYSYGGYMACWLSATDGRFKAAVPGGCVSDLTSMSGTSDAGYFLKMFECCGDLAAQSPLTHVAAVTAPTLLLHGERDDRCPVGQAEQWFSALRERGVPARLVRYPGASHLFIIQGRPSHRLDYNERIVAWLEQWVIGSES